MNKKVMGAIVVLGIIIATGVTYIGANCWRNRKVEFADANMAKVLCATIYEKDVTPENVTYEKLKEVEDLDIGYSGYYETIIDIGKCENLESLYINSIVSEYGAAYQIAQGEIKNNLTNQEVEELQEELTQILPMLKKLKKLWLANLGGCEWTSIEFLLNCGQIENLHLYSCVTHDYSALKSCPSLKVVSLWDCNISSADDIIGLENIEYITLRNTPLGDKPEEIKKLQEAYPDAVIDVANYEEGRVRINNVKQPNHEINNKK